MSKYYAVKKGKHPGVYKTWSECQQQVSGFSGAIYKSFPTLTDAQEWLQKTPTNKAQRTKEAVNIVGKDSRNTIELFTDGGSRNHGNKLGQHVKSSDKAAWALLIVKDGQKYTATGGEFGATNNRMELMAFRNALALLIKHHWNQYPINATLDSHYVLDPLTKGWLYGWQKRGWRTSSGSEVANKKTWEQVLHLLPQFRHLNYQWTKGHADNEGNVIVDHLLNKTMDKMGDNK